MSHDTLVSRNRCSFFVLLLGVAACGDASSLVMAPVSGGTPAATDATTLPAAPLAGTEPTPAEPAPTPSASADPGGADEGAGAEPIRLEPASLPEAGSSEEEPPPSSEPASEPPAADEPVAEEPVAGAPAAEEPVADEPHADEPPSAEEPVAEEPHADEPPTDAPDGDTSLARGDDPTRQLATSAGPFDVSIVTTGLRDGPDYGSQTLHVPEGVEPPLAAVAIIPGRDEDESSIAAWGPFLASHGIVTLTLGTNDPGDDPDTRALALLDALETIRAENRRAGGPLEGQLALDHLGVMGWSSGGAAVLRVASSTPSLKAAIALAPFSPGGQFPEDQVPTLLLAGSADPRAGGQSQGLFDSLPGTTPRMLFEVRDGVHEVGNDPRNANGQVGLYGLSWLEVFLVGDERYRALLEETPSQASEFRASLGRAP